MTVVDIRIVVSRLSRGLRPSLEAAVARAATRSHPTVEGEHWLAVLGEGNPEFRALLEDQGVNPDIVVAEVSRLLDHQTVAPGRVPALSPQLLDWIQEAWLLASLRFGRGAVAEVDLLLALTTHSVLRATIRNAVPSLRLSEERLTERAAAELPTENENDSGMPVSRGAGVKDRPNLSAYTQDMTADAREGRIDPVVGRDIELRQVIDILVRRRQNNPILTGEAGVGKTAIVEALALRIASGDVPPLLRGVELRSLDMGLLQAGAGVKGEFERRLKGVIDEIKASVVPVILFVDEAHTLIGAGNQAGQGDAANLLKPALARGELRTIAATTWAEYKRYFERDAALTRRFQVVKVDEPDEATATRMLRCLVPKLEKHHGVLIRDEAVRAAVQLSARYIPARQLPDKGVSLIDTAAASVAISRSVQPEPIETLLRERELLAAERDALLHDPSSERAERLHAIETARGAIESKLEALDHRLKDETALVEEADRLERLARGEMETTELHTLDDGAEDAMSADAALEALADVEKQLRALQGEKPLLRRVVDRDAVAAVVARWTGIPVGRLMRDSVTAALTLEERMGRRIIGQPYALNVVASGMRTATARLSDPRKPPHVFLMVGTSGVGKTETALALADLIYGGEQHLTVINMSEFKEEHKVSTLVGSPPGYVGYGEGGVLTEAVRRRPHGVLLLDEIEKAHPGVQDVFYQVFDKGMLRDGEGRDIDFRHTTIILTANAGAETLAALAADPETMPEAEALVDALRPELLRFFKPAFLGRVAIVPYLPLDQESLRSIARLQIEKVRARLEEAHRAELFVSDTVEDRIVALASVAEIGARAIETIIAKEILPRLSTLVLERSLCGEPVGRIALTVTADGGFCAQAEKGRETPGVSFDPVGQRLSAHGKEDAAAPQS